MLVRGDNTLLAWIYLSIGVGAFKFITGAAVGTIFSTLADSTEEEEVVLVLLAIAISLVVVTSIVFGFTSTFFSTFDLTTTFTDSLAASTKASGEAKCWAIKTVAWPLYIPPDKPTPKSLKSVSTRLA